VLGKFGFTADRLDRLVDDGAGVVLARPDEADANQDEGKGTQDAKDVSHDCSPVTVTR
jgi:hypothetical protein